MVVRIRPPRPRKSNCMRFRNRLSPCFSTAPIAWYVVTSVALP
jgi:hypothetical protein